MSKNHQNRVSCTSPKKNYNNKKATLPYIAQIFLINNWPGWIVLHDMQVSEDRPGIAECCGGNTQGSGASGFDNKPLNNFIDRFCSLQLTGHTTPVYFSPQQPWTLLMCQLLCGHVDGQVTASHLSKLVSQCCPKPQNNTLNYYSCLCKTNT